MSPLTYLQLIMESLTLLILSIEPFYDLLRAPHIKTRYHAVMLNHSLKGMLLFISVFAFYGSFHFTHIFSVYLTQREICLSHDLVWILNIACKDTVKTNLLDLLCSVENLGFNQYNQMTLVKLKRERFFPMKRSKEILAIWILYLHALMHAV